MASVKNWTPINTNFRFGGAGGSAMATTSMATTLDQLITLTQNFQDKIVIYDQMDSTIDISRALDIIAEDISSDGANDDDAFIIDYPDEVKISKNTLKTIDAALRQWSEKTELNYCFFDYVREALKYGIVLFEKNKNGTLSKLEPRFISGFIYNVKNPKDITHYTYNDPATDSNSPSQQTRDIEVKKLLIIKIGEGPFGQSILDRVYRTWKQMILMEDSIVIYRLVRSPERRIFYIDVGGMSSRNSEAYLMKIKRDLKQRQINAKNNMDVDTMYNPANIQEDYFIAQNGEGKGSKIETLPGASNLGEIGDLEYFKNNLALGLRIPQSYLYSGKDGAQQYNDGKVGTAYITELRYAGYIKRLQKSFVRPLKEHFELFCKALGVELPEEIIFKIAEPQSFGIYKENDINTSLLQTVSSAENIEYLSKRFILQKYLNLTPSEISDNEEKRLKEMGYDPSKLSEEEKINIVYGDSKLMNKEE